jgi:phage/plasmid primase-like uncharacterized protein
MSAAQWTAWVDQARNADILATAQSLGARLKKSSTTEWEGPCLVCGGTDRFSINVKKRIFNCRKCGIAGNVIGLVQAATGAAFLEACEHLNGTPRPDRSRDETAEQRSSRLAENAARNAAYQQRQEEDRAAEAARARHTEQIISAVLDRAVPISGTHGEAYLRGRGLNPHKRFVGDIKFVPDLDYWGVSDNGTRSIVHLATLPAIVAVIRNFASDIIGISQTYLDPVEPRKWTPTGSPTNSPTKIRGEKRGGMIRLGKIGEVLALGEGWANCLAWHQLGHGPENVTLAAAIDLGNLAGGATGHVDHPVATDADGRKLKIKNGVPDPKSPGVILPDGAEVKQIILLADLDSETYSTAAHLRTAAKRFLAKGISVELAWPDRATDWNDVLIREMMMEAGHGVAAASP